MGVPFAELTSESEVWNLQLHFWRNAVEHFYNIQHAGETEHLYEDSIFGVDACMVIVLAGTSISQLLGQQWRENKLRELGDDDKRGVPRITDLFNRLAKRRDFAFEAKNIPPDIEARFKGFVTLYDAIRHFGEPKEKSVGSINPESLCLHLHTAQFVWWLVGYVLWDVSPSNDFCHDFELGFEPA